MSNAYKEWLEDQEQEIHYAQDLFFDAYPDATQMQMWQDENMDFFIIFAKNNKVDVGAIFDRGTWELTLLDTV